MTRQWSSFFCDETERNRMVFHLEACVFQNKFGLSHGPNLYAGSQSNGVFTTFRLVLCNGDETTDLQ